jgi:hypothetical protein
MPGTVPTSDLKRTSDGFFFVDPAKFATDVAADLPAAQAEFMANSQMAGSGGRVRGASDRRGMAL